MRDETREPCLEHSGLMARLAALEHEMRSIYQMLVKIVVALVIAISLSAAATIITSQVRLSRIETILSNGNAVLAPHLGQAQAKETPK